MTLDLLEKESIETRYCTRCQPLNEKAPVGRVGAVTHAAAGSEGSFTLQMVVLQSVIERFFCLAGEACFPLVQRGHIFVNWLLQITEAKTKPALPSA
ncbi:hypothetical protein TH63_10170 [Rufibacter radiotolerans]|uniref:Uncharacterized protein n=1 Tax=Rufibacter radiotolerans TaxID=1379910 RepID=A0A0H4VJD1_9BACT|nr:hypothetical protein TH63_10170 [Rufibacter radiotolerans]